MRFLGIVLFFAAAAALIPAPFIYHVTSGGIWRYSPVGRSLMKFLGVLAGVMLLSVGNFISRVFGHGRLPDWVGVATWGAIAFVSWQIITTMVRVRTRKSHGGEA